MTAFLLVGLALAQDDELYLADMGVTATLPSGWSVPRWSDWDLDAVDARSTVQIHVGYTMWQVPPTEDSARVWSGLAAEELREAGHDKVEMVSTAVTEIDGIPTVELELSYRYQGKSKAVRLQRSFNVSGRTVHVSAMAVTSNRHRAEAALDTWVGEHLEIGKPAEDVSGLDDFGSESGNTTTLPPGWRNALSSEIGETRRLASEMLKQSLDPEKCWVAVHPYPDGEAALMMSCGAYPLYIGQIDEHSFAGKDAEVRSHFFGTAPVDPGLEIPAGSDARQAFFYALPEISDRRVYMAVSPYDQGQVLSWVVSRPMDGGDGDAARIEGALKSSVAGIQWDGPAEHPVGLALYVDYLMSYRSTDPIVFGPIVAFLGLIAFGGIAMSRRKKGYEDV